MPTMDNEASNDQVAVCAAGSDSTGMAAQPVVVSRQAGPAIHLWRRTRLLVAALLCSFGVGAAVYFLRPVGVNGQGGTVPEQLAKAPRILAGWDKPSPDLVIAVSGQMHGYLQPCGCSEPQFGGLTRRYNLIKSLKDKGWPIAAIDLGEIAQSHGPQAVLKYEYSMKALELMGYAVMGLGKTEFNMPFGEAMAKYPLNHKTPAVVVSNLIDQNGNLQILGGHTFAPINVKPQLGVFSVVDAKIAAEIKDPSCKFSAAASTLAKEMIANRASVNILIYHGTDANNYADIRKFIAEFDSLRQANPAIPQVPIILCLTDNPEPPARHKVIGTTTVVSVGWKGRYVGLIGLFANAGVNKGYSLKYESVSIGPEFDTPNNPQIIANHPLMKLMEQYTREVRDFKDKDGKRYIDKFPRSPHPMQVEMKPLGIATEYVGSKECRRCHDAAYEIWDKSHHSHAFSALEEPRAKNPSLRQFDGECVVCHTVGFQYTSGYMAPGNNPKDNDRLKNVGCESCHGPGAAHAAKPNDERLRALLNPLSTTKRMPERNNTPELRQAWVESQFRKQDDFCQKCHDQENDNKYGKVPFQAYWKQIEHYNRPPRADGAPIINIAPAGPAVTPVPPNGPELRPGNK
jgi:Cytochrome c554 and c-prime